jgi:hypothetical protein
MSNTEYTLVFGLGPKGEGTPNTDVDIAIAALEDASLKSCGGFTIHRGKRRLQAARYAVQGLRRRKKMAW